MAAYKQLTAHTMHTGLIARASGLQMRAFWPLKDAGVEGGALTSLVTVQHVWAHAPMPNEHRQDAAPYKLRLMHGSHRCSLQ